MDELKPGRYQHYKGKFYELIGVGKHRETFEEFVVYRALYNSEEFGEKSLWIRSKKMFIENVMVEGKQVPRFRYVGNVNIEVEVRSFISKEKYESLLEFFKQHDQFVKEDYQENYYFDSEADLRTQKNSQDSKIFLKEGKIHDDFREEIEVKFDRDSFDKVNKIFESLGYNVEIKWFRKRFQFNWQEIKVCLDYTKGYGYIVELEKMSDDENKEEILSLLKDRLRELGVEETSKEEFNRKFAYYKENWRELINGN